MLNDDALLFELIDNPQHIDTIPWDKISITFIAILESRDSRMCKSCLWFQLTSRDQSRVNEHFRRLYEVERVGAKNLIRAFDKSI